MKILFISILILTYAFSSNSKPLKTSSQIMPDNIEIEKQKLLKFPDDLLPSHNNENSNNSSNDNENNHAKINETKRILEEIEKINKSLGYHKKTEATHLKYPTLIWNFDEYLFPRDNFPFYTQSLSSFKLLRDNQIFPVIPISLLQQQQQQQQQQQRAIKSQWIVSDRGDINSKFYNSFHTTNDNYLRLPEKVKTSENEHLKTPTLFPKLCYGNKLPALENGHKNEEQYNVEEGESEFYEPIYYAIPVRLIKPQKYYFRGQQQQQQQQQHREQHQEPFADYRNPKIMENIKNADQKLPISSLLLNTVNSNSNNNNNNDSQSKKYGLNLLPQNLFVVQSEENIVSKNLSDFNLDKLSSKTVQSKAIPTINTLTTLTTTTTTIAPQSVQTFSKRMNSRPGKSKANSNMTQDLNGMKNSILHQQDQQQLQKGEEQLQTKFIPNNNLKQEANATTQNSLKGVFHNFFKLPFKHEVKPQSQQQTSTRPQLQIQQQQQQQQSLSTKPPTPFKVPQILQFSNLAATNPIVWQSQQSNQLQQLQQQQLQQQQLQQQHQQQALSDLDYTDYRWEDEKPFNYNQSMQSNNNKKNNKTIASNNLHKTIGYHNSDELLGNQKFLGHHHHASHYSNIKVDVEKEALKQGSIVIHKLKVRKGGIAIAGPGGVATAGSGGTAIVGPGGYVLSHPRSLSIVGPGAKVIAIPENIDLKDALQRTNLTSQLLPREGRIVATGPTVYYAPPLSELEPALSSSSTTLLNVVSLKHQVIISPLLRWPIETFKTNKNYSISSAEKPIYNKDDKPLNYAMLWQYLQYFNYNMKSSAQLLQRPSLNFESYFHVPSSLPLPLQYTSTLFNYNDVNLPKPQMESNSNKNQLLMNDVETTTKITAIEAAKVNVTSKNPKAVFIAKSLKNFSNDNDSIASDMATQPEGASSTIKVEGFSKTVTSNGTNLPQILFDTYSMLFNIKIAKNATTNNDTMKSENKMATSALILEPHAKAVVGNGGTAISMPLTRAHLKYGIPTNVYFNPESVAIAGVGGKAYAQAELQLDIIS